MNNLRITTIGNMLMTHKSLFILVRWLLLGLILSLGPGLSPALAESTRTSIDVTIPNGYLNISVEDMRLESTGDTVRWTRLWDGQEWKFNPYWESLSVSWKNLTCGTAVGSLSNSGPSGTSSTPWITDFSLGYWLWVDEDWTPLDPLMPGGSAGGGSGGGIGGSLVPTVMPPQRITPFNMSLDQAGVNTVISPGNVSINPSSLCSVAGGSTANFEGFRRLNELYLGSNGRYTFGNMAVLETMPVKGLPTAGAAELDAQLATGSITLSPVAIPIGFHWTHKEGDWIDYNLKGQVVAYGDSNDNTVWMVRDTNGSLRGVVDANGRVLYTLHYTGELLTEVRDYPIAGNNLDLVARKVSYQYDAYNRLIQVTDVRGNITHYDYDVFNHVVKITDPEGRIEQYTYAGDMVSQRTAADGAVTDYVFDYDDVNQQFISKITGPVTSAGRRVDDYTHDRSGKLLRLVTNGRIDVNVQRDPAARAESRTNARGFTTRFTKNEFERIVRVDYPDGVNRQLSYSSSNLRLTEAIDEAGIKTQYDYDAKGNLLKMTEAVGTPDQRVTELLVNALGQTIQVTRKGRTEANSVVTPNATWLIEYGEQGQITKTTDPEGGVHLYTFDRIGNLTSVTDPLGHTTRYEAYTSSNLTKITDALGRIKSFTYDKVGNLTAFTDARGKQTLANYDAMNRLLQTTNPVGGIATSQYNKESLPTAITDEDGRGIQISFDNFQRLTQLTDGEGNQAQLAYNIPDGTPTGTLGSLSMPTEIKFPTFTQNNRLDALERPNSEVLLNANRAGTESLASGTTYDPRGLVKSDTDANGNIRTYAYNAFRQIINYTDALGNKTTALYDVRDNLIQLTDANGNAHKFEYDRNNRVVKEILPLGQATDYSYDTAGNLIQRIDPNNTKTTYTYDATNWLVEIKQYQGGTQLTRTTTFTWDDAYNLTAWTDTDATRPDGQQTASSTATYDDDNRKTGEIVNYPNPSGLPYSLSYSYQYSLAGKKVRLTWADGTAIDYGYSAHGELESVTIPGEGILSVNQFKWTEPASITLPGGSVQEKAYDGLLNLEGFKVKTPSQLTLLDLANNYGKRQELTQRVRSDSGATISGTFSYDDELRLTQSVIDTGSLLGADTETFSLDGVGNRTAHSKIFGPWNYDANNRLTDKGILFDASQYEYDEAGNLIRKIEPGKTTQFIYDTQNRLTEVRDGSANLVARYGYDPFDRRIWKEQYRDGNDSVLVPAVRSYFLYADEGLISESQQDIALNADLTVSSSAAPTIMTQYGQRPDELFGTGVLFVKTKNSNDADTFAYYHHDHLGTPIQATDKNGFVVWSAQYNVYGQASITTPAASIDRSTITSRLRFPGQVEDEETGLHYNWHRYYDPDNGRYLTQDPIGISGGINVYEYVKSNPIAYTDPTGEFLFVPILVGAAWGGGTDLLIQLIMNGARIDCVNWGQVATGAAVGAVGGAIGGTLAKLRRIRQTYQTGLAAARQEGLSAEQAWLRRRSLGAKLKHEVPQPFREGIYRRNLKEYGDKLGPKFDPIKMSDPTKTLTDTNPYADSLLNLPENGLPSAGGAVGGIGAAALGGNCGCPQ